MESFKRARSPHRCVRHADPLSTKPREVAAFVELVDLAELIARSAPVPGLEGPACAALDLLATLFYHIGSVIGWLLLRFSQASATMAGMAIAYWWNGVSYRPAVTPVHVHGANIDCCTEVVVRGFALVVLPRSRRSTRT